MEGGVKDETVVMLQCILPQLQHRCHSCGSQQQPSSTCAVVAQQLDVKKGDGESMEIR